VSARPAEPLSTAAQVLLFSLSGLSCAAVVLLFERFRVERSRAVTAVALISYSIYLTHFEVFSYFIRRPASGLGGAVLTCAAAVVVALGVSWLLYAVVERPFMALRDRRAHRSAEARVDA
jgi:peptidoglycan/LPS O-acetylase OafA/YrhL